MKTNEVIFEFYLISNEVIMDGLQQSDKLKNENFEQTLSMDLDHVWVLALRVLHLFEETINSAFPSIVIFLKIFKLKSIKLAFIFRFKIRQVFVMSRM
jgi:hypothetical protein